MAVRPDLVEYGCECVCKVHQLPEFPADKAPVTWLVHRDGKFLRVCSRCDRSTDTDRMLLIDDSCPAIEYIRYDLDGAIRAALWPKPKDNHAPN